MRTRTIFQKLLLVLSLSLSLDSCFKGDPPIPFIPPSEIRIDATVPEIIYLNQKLIVLDARRTNLINGHRTLRYRWSCPVYPSNVPPKFSHPDNELTFIDSLRAGTYQLQLAVTDTIGNSTVSLFNMIVKNDSLSGPPTMNVLRDTVISLPNPAITLNGSVAYSVNPPCRDLQFLWSLLQQPTGSPPIEIPNKTNPVTNIRGYIAGTYQFYLVVTNDLGLSTADTMEVTIAQDTSKTTSKIYENLPWKWQESEWGGFSYYLLINDPAAFINRNISNMEVQLWDDQRQNWSAPDRFGWSLDIDALRVDHYGTADPIAGTITRAKITFY
jgi:hypothetical protein